MYSFYHVDPLFSNCRTWCTLLNRRPFPYQVGALVVKDVKPYEFMKLRLLNGGHSCLSYISVLCGYSYVDDAMADPLISGKYRTV